MPGLFWVVSAIAILLALIYASTVSRHLVHMTIDDGELLIRPRGLNKIWCLNSQVTIPISCIRAARIDERPPWPRGLRLPGTAVPGLTYARCYYSRGARSFYAIGRGRAIVLDLVDYRYELVVVQIKEEQRLVTEINERAGRTSS